MRGIARDAAAYPDRLRELAEPPERLYVRPPAGATRLTALLAPPVVAVVGARHASEAGMAFARRLGRELGAAGVAVVSGLALGIDAAAHEGALAAGGRAVAVLGCGIDRDYPAANAGLARRLGEHGAIISEYPGGTPPAPWRFPARNRIVAALADAVCVVEASRRSGALITAGIALDLGRDVLAAPAAPWYELGAGANGLLRDGAQVLADTADALVAVGLDPGAEALVDAVLEPDAARLLQTIRRAPATPEHLGVRLGLGPGRLAVALCELELAGLVVRERDGSLAPA